MVKNIGYLLVGPLATQANTLAQVTAERDALKAENERLREALRDIEHEGPATSEYTSAHAMAQIARDALTPAEAAGE